MGKGKKDEESYGNSLSSRGCQAENTALSSGNDGMAFRRKRNRPEGCETNLGQHPSGTLKRQ